MKLAFIGFRHGHIFGLYELARAWDEIEIVAACEEDAATRAQLAASGSVHITHTDYATMLDTVECDAVVVGDYFSIRGEQILQALRQGRHVLADKPLCTELSELDEIERLAMQRNLCVGCMLDFRDTPQSIGLRNLVQSGALGEIHAIAFGGQHPLLLSSRPSWYFEPGKHGGTLNDIAVHALDAIPWITGRQFVAVDGARTWNALATDFPHFHDAAQLMLTLDNGGGVIGDVSYTMPDSQGYTSPHYWRMTLWGSRGVAETSMTQDHMLLVMDGESEPRREPLPPANEGGYLRAFLDDIAGTPQPDALTTAGVLHSSRIALRVQQIADESHTATPL